MRISVKKKAITTTALISMTDVVFLLLIFLLITSNFITYTGIPINIPVAEHAHADMQRNLSLAINEREEIFINDVKVHRDELVDRLRIEIEKTPDVVVMIQADQNIALKNVVELIDAAKEAGSSRFFIAAQLIRQGA
jgi:biopolymer transport protein ExbD